ncbi:MAG: ATP-binding protein [Desulfurococcales archaeon]|nr:ATP-binding protein [Desulfurococcales archaeon]
MSASSMLSLQAPLDVKFIKEGKSDIKALNENIEKLNKIINNIYNYIEMYNYIFNQLTPPSEPFKELANVLFTYRPPYPNQIVICGSPGMGKTTLLLNYVGRQAYLFLRYIMTGMDEYTPQVLPLNIIYPNLMPPGDHPLAWVVLHFNILINELTKVGCGGHITHIDCEKLREASELLKEDLEPVASLVATDHTRTVVNLTTSPEEYVEEIARLSRSGAELASTYQRFSKLLRSAVLGRHADRTPILIPIDDLDAEPHKIYETLLTVRLLSADPYTLFLIALRCDYSLLESIVITEIATRLTGGKINLTQDLISELKKTARNLLIKNLLVHPSIDLGEYYSEERILEFKPISANLRL